MKEALSAMHLVRAFVLFALTVVFLLTLTRAGFSLWQFPKVLEADALADMFVTGLRFDAALIGTLLLPAVVVGTFLSMFSISRGLAKLLIVAWLVLGLLYVMLAELITPYFLANDELRPDWPLLKAIENPVEALAGLWSAHLIPAAVGTALACLILIAFIARLETNRLLRYRIARPSGFVLMIVGAALCLLAIWSSVDPETGPLAPSDSLVSADMTINDISVNSGHKLGWSLVAPLLPSAPPAEN